MARMPKDFHKPDSKLRIYYEKAFGGGYEGDALLIRYDDGVDCLILLGAAHEIETERTITPPARGWCVVDRSKAAPLERLPLPLAGPFKTLRAARVAWRIIAAGHLPTA